MTPLRALSTRIAVLKAAPRTTATTPALGDAIVSSARHYGGGKTSSAPESAAG
ncbi:hypothetical protein VTH06DRAFT_2767, partial [Thermothelomyces fergusii]